MPGQFHRPPACLDLETWQRTGHDNNGVQALPVSERCSAIHAATGARRVKPRFGQDVLPMGLRGAWGRLLKAMNAAGVPADGSASSHHRVRTSAETGLLLRV